MSSALAQPPADLEDIIAGLSTAGYIASRPIATAVLLARAWNPVLTLLSLLRKL